MSDITVDKINNLAGTGAANFTYGIKVGGSLQGLGGGAFTNSDTEPTSPSDGDVWYQPTLRYLDYRAGGEWKRVVGSGTANPLPPVWFGDRALFTLGFVSAGRDNRIQYYDLDVGATVNTFGNLLADSAYVTGASGGGRGLFAGAATSSGVVNTIQYITIASTGNSTDFGDLTEVSYTIASASNGNKAIYAMNDNNKTSLIQEVTIDTAGNATAWSGTLTQAKSNGCGASDGTKGFFFGGRTASSSTAINEIDYVTIATDGNASDWGNLATARKDTGGNSACGTSSRILIGGGTNSSGNYTATIDYINPASAGNASSFGNLANALWYTGSTNNDTHAIWVQGLNASVQFQNYAHRVTIDTTGNASLWGTTAEAGYGIGATSGAHS
jgi:hypothetical protein